MKSTIKIDAGDVQRLSQIINMLHWNNHQYPRQTSTVDDLCTEALNIVSTAQPQPEVTDAERLAALSAFDDWLKQQPLSDFGSAKCEVVLQKNAETIRAALLAPSVQEVTTNQLNEKLDDLCDSVEEMHKDDLIKFLQSFPNGLRIVRGEGEKS